MVFLSGYFSECSNKRKSATDKRIEKMNKKKKRKGATTCPKLDC